MTKKKIIKYRPKVSVVSVAEGKKRFSSLIRDADEDSGEFIVTKRGKPIAALIPYDEYKQAKRLAGYKKILTAREIFQKAGVSADKIFKESKRQLENRS